VRGRLLRHQAKVKRVHERVTRLVGGILPHRRNRLRCRIGHTSRNDAPDIEAGSVGGLERAGSYHRASSLRIPEEHDLLADRGK
jgi:hypothetical protein